MEFGMKVHVRTALLGGVKPDLPTDTYNTLALRARGIGDARDSPSLCPPGAYARVSHKHLDRKALLPGSFYE